MMRRGALFTRLLFLAAAFAALPALALALEEIAPGLEEHSLLTPGGTLHVVRSGRALDLGIQDASIDPNAFVVDWASRAQDGTISTQVIPGTVGYQERRGLQLGWDDPTSTLLLVWTEEVSAFSHIRVGIYHDGTWTNSPLLPKQGISRSYNPQMRITHQRVSYLDENDVRISKTTSILSVVWWEEGQGLQARLATLFLDENGFDPTNLAIYDLPAMAGGTAATVYNDVPAGAYLYPGLQPDGLSGAILVSFADLHADRHRVIRISFPEDQGKPSNADDTNWKRRHIPIVGFAGEGPVARMLPRRPWGDREKGIIGTTIGAGYQPTLYWREGDNLQYARLEGAEWSPIRSIAIDEATPYDKALALVAEMAGRN
jgi:hypothetical protein